MADIEEPIETQETRSRLRQISEPHAQALPEGQDEAVPSVRRLASDYVAELVRNADDTAVQNAARPLGHACKRELKTLCESELKLLQATFRITNGQWNSPLMVEGLRNTQVCLAENADELSPPCMDAIITAFLKTQVAPVGGEANDVWQPLMPSKPDSHNGKQDAKRGKMRHHHHDEDDSEDSKTPTQGLEIYVINNNGGNGGERNENAIGWGKRHRHHHDHGHGTHPLVWMIVLPFFCLGVFVSVKHAVAYIKKRRAASLPYATATQSHEYEPLKMADSPSHES